MEGIKHVLKNMDKYSQMWTFIPRFGLSPRLDFPLKTMHSDLVEAWS